LITNCGNNYGPYQFPEKFIPTLDHRALKGQELPIYGGGANVRDWIHVEDHARACSACSPSERLVTKYLIGRRGAAAQPGYRGDHLRPG
jgi:dTDP-glucose 4,6-dehydratase